MLFLYVYYGVTFRTENGRLYYRTTHPEIYEAPGAVDGRGHLRSRHRSVREGGKVRPGYMLAFISTLSSNSSIAQTHRRRIVIDD